MAELELHFSSFIETTSGSYSSKYVFKNSILLVRPLQFHCKIESVLF